MQSIKCRLATAPEGATLLFFIQVFSTLGYAVLYSTLVFYVTKHLQFPVKTATALMGVFAAFNYWLHLFGHYEEDPQTPLFSNDCGELRI